jgi:hypothetical protein
LADADADADDGGGARGYSWAPFGPGNQAAMTSGFSSERQVGPLADRIARELLEDAATPPHVREPLFAASVQAWARAEAAVRLIWEWLAERDLMTALTELTTSTEEEGKDGGGVVRRKATTRHVGSVLEALRKYETLAMNLRSKLGLDPAAAARVGRDLAERRYLDANATPLAAALAEIDARRRAVTGGDGG